MQFPARNRLTTGTTSRLFLGSGLVVLLEGAIRVALVVAMEPHWGTLWVLAAVVVWPPIVTVVGIGVSMQWVMGTGDSRDGDTPRRDAGDTSRLGRLPVSEIATRTVVLGVIGGAGHIVAIVLGTVVFLLVDTPVRYALYWIGYGDLFTFAVVTYSPFVGIALGTIVAWAIPAIAVVGIGTGGQRGPALWNAIVAPVTRPRAVAMTAVGTTVLAILAVGGVYALGEGTAWIDQRGVAIGSRSVAPVAFVLGGTILVLASATCLAGTTVFVRERFTPIDRSSAATSTAGGSRVGRTGPAVRLLLVVLLVTALVTTASVVRTNEVRPVDTTPEPLPDDPDRLYATAYENTDRANHEYRWLDVADDSDEATLELRIDRRDRRMTVTIAGHEQYYSHGLLATGQPAPVPGYAIVRDDGPPRIGQPRADIDGWTIVAEDDDEITLELVDSEGVTPVVEGEDPVLYDGHDVNESWTRMTIDADDGTLSHGEHRLNTTDPDDREGGIDRHVRWEYETGDDVTVDRPAEFGTPGLGERFWRLFAY